MPSRTASDPVVNAAVRPPSMRSVSATRASVDNFGVAGKTGTSRRTGANGRYVGGSYTGSFVGYFPASDPQIVILVKIDEPRGDYYGGLTAAPVTRETLQGILASRTSSLDLGRFVSSRAIAPASGSALLATTASTPAKSAVAVPHVVEITDESRAEAEKAPPRSVQVPELTGLPLREAVRRAHSGGFLVRLQGGGNVARTLPNGGVNALAGDTLLIVGERR